MGLQELWFLLIAALFLGFLILEGFDFGVGMLMAPMGSVGDGDPEARRRAVLNTIGPVWDANEVWLITAGAAMFAAFPNWYATVFSALYLPLLAILFGMILRIVGIEWRGKIDDPRWRKWADVGIAVGSWLPAILWGVAFAILVRGLPIDAGGQRPPVDRRRAQRLHTARRPGHRVAVRVLRGGVRRPQDRGAGARGRIPVRPHAVGARDRACRRLRTVDAAGARQELDVVGAGRRRLALLTAVGPDVGPPQ